MAKPKGLIIAVNTQKGGVGKSTISVNFSAGLAKLGNKVLVIDYEPQANTTTYTGAGRFVPDVTMADVLERKADIKRTILHGQYYDLACNSKKMKAVIATAPGFTGNLAEQLDNLRKEYDYIIIDTPPSVSILTTEALNASDYMIIPLQLQKGAVDAVTDDIDAFKVAKTRNKKLKNYIFLPNMYRGVASYDKNYLQELNKEFPGQILPPIRLCQKLADSQTDGGDIFSTYPNSNGATDFLNACTVLDNYLTSKNKKGE